MAQEGYDRLMALTDSRYRMTMIVARRAAQLKTGVPTLLEEHERPETSNTVTIAMKELELGKPIEWGDDLPSTEEIMRALNLASPSAADRPDFGRYSQAEE